MEFKNNVSSDVVFLGFEHLSVLPSGGFVLNCSLAAAPVPVPVAGGGVVRRFAWNRMAGAEDGPA